MFYDDHTPPHFHVHYGEHKATVAIEDLRILEGRLPPRVRGLVVEWATLHQDELSQDWTRARERRPLAPIEPLE